MRFETGFAVRWEDNTLNARAALIYIWVRMVNISRDRGRFRAI